MTTASPISASVAPFSLANSVCAWMQYSHGICADTASPTSSLILPGSAVPGFNCSPFMSIHAPGSASSGTSLTKPGTNPKVFWMSARAASPCGVASAADGAPATAANARINSGIFRSLFIGISFSNVGDISTCAISTRGRQRGYAWAPPTPPPCHRDRRLPAAVYWRACGSG
jgi:hypothetical protein